MFADDQPGHKSRCSKIPWLQVSDYPPEEQVNV